MQTAVVVTNEARIVAKARKGLAMVTEGENKTMEGWLLYGAALNEGREMFPRGDNQRFSEWLASANLAVAHDHDRLAAMWAAANPQDFLATKKANPRVRTVRGLHAKFKAPEPGPSLEPTEDDLKTMGRLKTLAERGATEGERQAAQTKLDAYAGAFGGSKEAVIEKAADAAKLEEDSIPHDTQVQKLKTALTRAGTDFLAEWLLKAMVKDHELFKAVMERLYKNP